MLLKVILTVVFCLASLGALLGGVAWYGERRRVRDELEGEE